MTTMNACNISIAPRKPNKKLSMSMYNKPIFGLNGIKEENDDDDTDDDDLIRDFTRRNTVLIKNKALETDNENNQSDI